MKIIVGLGNPGLRYRNTRHNAGFMALKLLAKKYKLSIRKKAFRGICGVGRIMQQEVMLFEPLTYMNLSGEAVKSIYSSKLDDRQDLLVISDDFNLPLGSVRLREKGSSGGHNGLQSIIEQIGPDFTRLRIGVGVPREGTDVVSYVLSSFHRSEKQDLNRVLEKAVECVETWLIEGTKKAMDQHN